MVTVSLLLIAAASQVPDRSDMELIFHSMDRNGDGYVTPSEEPQVRNIRSSTGRASVRVLGSWVGRHDGNGDGRVSREEFISRARAEIAAYRR